MVCRGARCSLVPPYETQNPQTPSSDFQLKLPRRILRWLSSFNSKTRIARRLNGELFEPRSFGFCVAVVTRHHSVQEMLIAQKMCSVLKKCHFSEENIDFFLFNFYRQYVR